MTCLFSALIPFRGLLASLPLLALFARLPMALSAADTSPNAPAREGSPARAVPAPLPEHPGNVFLETELIRIPLPESTPTNVTVWRLLDDQGQVVRHGPLPSDPSERRTPLALDRLDIGWYRVEFGSNAQPDLAWTTLAVLGRLRAPVPADSPVAVDSAAAWFARADAAQQQRFANLAALAGVSWVRDRLRWSDLQPQAGPLVGSSTTYDTSADAHQAAGLGVLQVFHDTPAWARGEGEGGGRFAPDLRHVYEFSRALARRFKGRVQAWEPWNEGNVASFGAHTVDQMCSWQKAAWLGFKAGDPEGVVGWNVTAAVPTPAHTEGVLANETWPYFDTYNIHTYDWSHGYAGLWKPAREAACGRPLWITEADRGTPHLKNPPWFDQDPRLERLKAEWMAQSYASSLFSGARRHFHFILGHYQEPNGIQFGLLRLDLTPRPAYVALAAVGRCLAGARPLGRWQPGQDVHIYAFRAQPNGVDRDVLVAWAEKEVDWKDRGQTTAAWALPSQLQVEDVVDYLGRSRGQTFPSPLGSAPVFVLLPPGQASTLPLEQPPALSAWRPGTASPVVLQLTTPRALIKRVEDVPWSEGFACHLPLGESTELKVHIYNFAPRAVSGRLRLERQPSRYEASLSTEHFRVDAMERAELTATVRIPADAEVRDDWVVLRADCGPLGQPALAFRVRAGDGK